MKNGKKLNNAIRRWVEGIKGSPVYHAHLVDTNTGGVLHLPRFLFSAWFGGGSPHPYPTSSGFNTSPPDFFVFHGVKSISLSSDLLWQYRQYVCITVAVQTTLQHHCGSTDHTAASLWQFRPHCSITVAVQTTLQHHCGSTDHIAASLWQYRQYRPHSSITVAVQTT